MKVELSEISIQISELTGHIYLVAPKGKRDITDDLKRIGVAASTHFAEQIGEYEEALGHYASFDNWQCSECVHGVDHDDSCLVDTWEADESDGTTYAAAVLGKYGKGEKGETDVDTCLACRHRLHEPGACFNIESDNGCDCLC